MKQGLHTTNAIRLAACIIHPVIIKGDISTSFRNHLEGSVQSDTPHNSCGFVYKVEKLPIAAVPLSTDNGAFRSVGDGTGVLVYFLGANLELEIGSWS